MNENWGWLGNFCGMGMVEELWGNLIYGLWNGREVIALKSAKINYVVK